MMRGKGDTHRGRRGWCWPPWCPAAPSWRGLNSLPLPGVQGAGPGAFTIQAQMPDVDNIEPNSRVRVGDVNVGNVTKIERQDWHALVTMELNGDVELPANATAKLGQTSLLGSLAHRIGAADRRAARGQAARRFADPVVVVRRHTRPPSRHWPRLRCCSTAVESANIQDITEALSTAFAGRENDLRSLIEQLDKAIGYLDDQKDDIIAATREPERPGRSVRRRRSPSWTRHYGRFRMRWPCSRDQRENLAEALAQLGKFSALAADSVNQTKEALVQELKDLGPVLESLANAGPALTRALSFLPTFPFPKETLHELDARRLREPDVDRRPDVEPDRLRILHRNAVGVRSDLAGAAVGPHHRPVPQPVHRGRRRTPPATR